MWRDSISGPPLVAPADPNFRSCLSARASCIASSMFLAIWSHAIKNFDVKTCASRLVVKKGSMKNRRHESATSVPLELGESLCFAISASHAFSPYSSSLTYAAGCASMRK